MNILYVNHYSGSISEPREWRPYYLSKALVKAGNKVTVICASWHHLQKNTSIIEKNTEFKLVDGVAFCWLKTPVYRNNGLKRIINMLSFGWRFFKYDPVKMLKQDIPDIIIISSAHPFHLLGGIRWAKKYNSKLVFEIRDLWPFSLNQLVGLKKYHPLSIMLSIFQYIGLKSADKVVGLCEGMDNYLVRRGMAQEKFTYICNGIDLTQPLKSQSVLDTRLTDLKNKHSKIAMYVGSLGVPNAMDVIIKAFNLINDVNVALVIIGGGTELENLKLLSKNNNIYFFDSIPKQEVQQALSYADICLISWRNIPVYDYGISPNKIFDYMLAKKPIIQSLNSKFNIIDKANCGVNIPAEKPHIFAQEIKKLFKMEKSDLDVLGLNGYSYLLKEHTYDTLSKKLLKCIGS